MSKTSCGFEYGFTNTSPPINLHGDFIAGCGAGFKTEELRQEHWQKHHSAFRSMVRRTEEEIAEWDHRDGQ